MIGSKRRQEGIRGVRVIPETYNVEGADVQTYDRRQFAARRTEIAYAVGPFLRSANLPTGDICSHRVSSVV